MMRTRRALIRMLTVVLIGTAAIWVASGTWIGAAFYLVVMIALLIPVRIIRFTKQLRQSLPVGTVMETTFTADEVARIRAQH